MVSRALLFGGIIPNALIGGFMKLTPGKLEGLLRVSDKRGVIAAAAMDQRGSLQKSLAKEKGGEVNDAMMEEFKTLVAEVLTPHASAILLDPEWGLPAAKRRAKNAGLLLAYEKTGYDKSIPGRLPSTLDGFSVARLKQAGADAVKILLYYSPFSAAEINARKYDWVRRVSAECIVEDVAFFLEIVCYHDEMDEKGPEFARIKPDVVVRSVEEFCKPHYAVDVIKVGVPVNMKFVQSASVAKEQALYTREEAIRHFRRASDACSLPFIYLSEGVSNELFGEALDLATAAGSVFSGVLCGRATWQDGVGVFVKHGGDALDTWLREQGVRNIQNVNERLASARPWHERAGATQERTA
jgi:tagatose 1,6-diphosphate aldolase